MDRSGIVREAWNALEPELANLGYELVEVEFGTSAARNALRLFIDRDGGITLDDCAGVSRHLSAYLDVLDFVPGEYVLEVSSPGVDRPVRKPGDFARFTGETIRVQTNAPVSGRRKFRGILHGISDGMIEIGDAGDVVSIHIENIKRANLDRLAKAG